MHADRGEVQKGSAEIFFRKVKFWKEDGEGDAPPIFVGHVINAKSSKCLYFLFFFNRYVFMQF